MNRANKGERDRDRQTDIEDEPQVSVQKEEMMVPLGDIENAGRGPPVGGRGPFRVQLDMLSWMYFRIFKGRFQECGGWCSEDRWGWSS